jgi:hypothetical protein
MAEAAETINKTTATPEQIQVAIANAERKVAEYEAQASDTAGGSTAGGSSSGGGQREQQCPFCNGKVLPNVVGRIFSSINGFLWRNFNIRIPTGLLEYLQSKIPVEKVALLKNPGECVCKGKRTIPDPSDDSAKWQESLGLAKANFEELKKLERDLAPACGNRYTIIQGCDLLEVGLGMNDAPSYRVDKGKSVRNARFADMGELNVEQAGPILKGGEANHVQGINSLASPGGHYMIKCANKFTVVAGAQGIELNTGGPLNISAGIIKCTGPELSIGTQTGRLSLEGETMNLNAKSIEAAPSDGHFVVRGSGGFTGNCTIAGHTHSESASVVNLSVPGKNETTNPSGGSDKQTGPAFWGSVAGEMIGPVAKDLVAHVLTNATHPKLAPNIILPRYWQSFTDKVLNLGYALRPVELVPTGICVIIAGTPTAIGGVGLIWNFPHSHQIPDSNHVHDMRVPDIDYSADNAGAVRAKAGGNASPAAKQTVPSLKSVLESVLWTPLLAAFPGLAALLMSDQK